MPKSDAPPSHSSGLHEGARATEPRLVFAHEKEAAHKRGEPCPSSSCSVADELEIEHHPGRPFTSQRTAKTSYPPQTHVHPASCSIDGKLMIIIIAIGPPLLRASGRLSLSARRVPVLLFVCEILLRWAARRRIGRRSGVMRRVRRLGRWERTSPRMDKWGLAESDGRTRTPRPSACNSLAGTRRCSSAPRSHDVPSVRLDGDAIASRDA